MKRVLVISPHFPPTNAPDVHRIRMALSYFREHGWQADVLCIHPDCVSVPQDPWLLETLPKDVRIIPVSKEILGLKRLGINSLWYRFGSSIKAAGSELLRRKKYDLIFFTTTQFPFMSLGPGWRKIFGVPYVLDYHDPWVNDYYWRHQVTPPGGWLRFAPQYLTARLLEPSTVKNASAVISVSSSYLHQLKKYNSPAILKRLTFGAPLNDLNFLTHQSEKPSRGKQRWAYIGRVTQDMLKALRPFFELLSHLNQQGRLQNLTIEFIGTHYYTTSSSTGAITALAQEIGLGEIVSEQIQRIPYREALEQTLAADVVLVIGSPDSSYSPSKIYPLLMCKRPLLAIGPASSKVHQLLHQFSGGRSCILDHGDSAIYSIEWALDQRLDQPYKALNHKAFARVTARAMTRRLCALFHQVAEAK